MNTPVSELAKDLRSAQTLDRIQDSLAEVRERVTDSAALEGLQEQASAAVDRLQVATEEAGERVRHLDNRSVAIALGAAAVAGLVTVLVMRRRRGKYAGQPARLG